LSSKNRRERLGVFAKTPRLGEVKTRLCPPLSAEQALALHRALVEDTLDRLEQVSRPELEHWIYTSEPLDNPADLTIPVEWTRQIQQGHDLGAKLENAFRSAFQDGVERMVVVGTDSPTVPLDCLYEAFDELKRYDCVIGPSLDGGYYLIGCSHFIAEIFQEVSWGEVTVLRETTDTLQRMQKSFNYLIDWYDIDTDEDLMRLREEITFYTRVDPSRVPKRVKAVLPSESED
jgi:rSAM/selenodomain-associated transferase 1